MEVDELRQQQKLLTERVAELDVCVRQDYRRRVDLTVAVAQVAGHVWTEINELSSRMKKVKASTEPKWQFGALAVGSVLAWLLQDGDKFQPNIGWGLIFAALVAWAMRSYAIYSHHRDMATLRRTEQQYLLHWLSSGAGDTNFWLLRDAFNTKSALEKTSTDTEDWRAKGAAIRGKEAELWHQVRLDALSAAVGEMVWLEPIDLRGPAA